MMSLKDYSKRIFLAVVIIVATLVIPWFIFKVFPHFVPFILAYFTALALDPFSKWFVKKVKIKRTAANSITFLIFLGIIGLFGYLIINKIYVQLIDLLSFFQENASGIQIWFMDATKYIQDTISLLPYDTANQINQFIAQSISNLTQINFVAKVGSYTLSLSTAIPNFFFLTLIYLISVYLFSFQLDNIHDRFYSLFKESSRIKATMVLGDLRKATYGFLKAQIIMSTITFIISFIGLMIIGVKYSAVIAFIIIIVDILPILGTGSILMPWALFALIRGNMFLGIGLVVLYLVITIVRRAIEPKILGERIGLGALTTLISIWVGFKVMGVLGVFLFPLAFIFIKALIRVKVIRFNYKI